MAKKKKKFIKLQCENCKEINYYTRKPRLLEKRLCLKKFCKKCKKHSNHKETKK